MRETLKKPDEIWLNHNNLDQMIYFKYFEDKTIITVVKLDNLIPSVKTWFALTDTNKKNIENYRHGLLLFKKRGD